MKNERGITLASVVVMIIIMIIIAGTGVIVGNKLIIEAKEEKEQQNFENVQSAVDREHVKYVISGVITPGMDVFIGTRNPMLGNTEDTRAGDDWYLLDEVSLAELGIEGIGKNYLVNYVLNKVIVVTDDVDAMLLEINSTI